MPELTSPEEAADDAPRAQPQIPRGGRLGGGVGGEPDEARAVGRGEQAAHVGERGRVEAEMEPIGRGGEGDVGPAVQQHPHRAVPLARADPGRLEDGAAPVKQGGGGQAAVAHLDPIDPGGHHRADRSGPVAAFGRGPGHEAQDGPARGRLLPRRVAQKLAIPSSGLEADA